MKQYPYLITANNIKQVIKVCQMYYQQDCSEREIATVLGCSRSQISKILLAAREQKIVNITIVNPFFEETELTNKLIDKYQLEDALILNTTDDGLQSVMSNCSSQISSFLSGKIKNDSVLGITSGYTLSALASNVEYIKKKNLMIVPLVGGGFSGGPSWQANINTHTLANKWHCECLQFNMPGFVREKEVKKLLLKEPEIKNLMTYMDKTDTALFGIGEFTNESTFIKTKYLTEEDIKELKKKKAAGGVCNFFYDNEGKLVEFSGYDRMIGIDPIKAKKIPTRIGVGFGESKEKTIKAALTGKWINCLITDINTATNLLK